MKEQIDSITQAFERLSAKEQGMVLFLVVALVGMFLGFGGYFVGKSLDLKKKQIAAKTSTLEEIAAMRGDYQRKLAEQNSLAEEVRKNKNLRVLTYLEDLSRKSKIELGNASERPGENTGSDQVQEVAAEVLIQNVSIDRLNAFLAGIEGGNRLVKVRRLKIRTRFDNATMLDASVTVGTFKPQEG